MECFGDSNDDLFLREKELQRDIFVEINNVLLFFTKLIDCMLHVCIVLLVLNALLSKLNMK